MQGNKGVYWYRTGECNVNAIECNGPTGRAAEPRRVSSNELEWVGQAQKSSLTSGIKPRLRSIARELSIVDGATLPMQSWYLALPHASCRVGAACKRGRLQTTKRGEDTERDGKRCTQEGEVGNVSGAKQGATQGNDRGIRLQSKRNIGAQRGVEANRVQRSSRARTEA